MYGGRGGYFGGQFPLITQPPAPDEPLTLDPGTGAGQGQGQTNEAEASYSWDLLSGQAVVSSGSSPTLAGAIADAKASIALQPAGSYGIVVRQAGATVYTENVTAGAGGGTEGEGGGAEGGGGGGDGGSSEGGGGFGQPGDMGFRYRLTGYKWTWDDKTASDPRLWKGHGAEIDLSASDYTYGNAIDALEAGKVAGDADVAVMRVFSESNYPSQFAGRQFTYSDRLTTASNAGAKEAADAYQYILDHPGTLDLPGPGGLPGDNLLSGIPQEAIIAVIAVVVIVAVIAVVISVGGA